MNFVGRGNAANRAVDAGSQRGDAVLDWAAQRVEVETVNGAVLIFYFRALTGAVVLELDAVVAGVGTVAKRIGSKSMAQNFRRKTDGELAAGTYQTQSRKSWDDFWTEFTAKILPAQAVRSQRETTNAVNHFERLVNPKRVAAIKTAEIDGYVSSRRTERGLKNGSTVSPATVNKELRHLKAVLRIAHEWRYLPEVSDDS